MKYIFILSLLFLSSCSYIEEVMNRKGPPDTRTQLESGQYMEFNRITRKNAQGRSIDEFKCPNEHLMVCQGNVSLDCTCRFGGL